jgi:putative ABC transport system permease protein
MEQYMKTIEILYQDLKYAFRGLKQNPIFTLVVCSVLALGIGANTALFSVVDKVLLRPLPFAESERLMDVHETKEGWPMSPSYFNYLDWTRMSQSFDSLALACVTSQTLPNDSGAERIPVAFVSGNFFETYRVKAFMGRLVGESDDKRGAALVAVLGRGFWKARFGADPNIIGKTITLEQRIYTIVGILPEFPYHNHAEVYVSIAPNTESSGLLGREQHMSATTAIGRLKAGIKIEQARAELKAVAAQLERQYPGSNKGNGADLVSLHDSISGGARHSLLVLFGAVAFLLLIACANVANLMLARAISREKEIAIRVALGAGRGQIIRQLLIESSLLGLLGGILGIMIAPVCINALLWLVPDSMASGLASPNWRIFLFTFGASILTALLFGLVPALQSTHIDIINAIKEGGRTSTQGSSRSRLRGGLVVAQVAMTLMLLAGTGLLIRSLYRMLGEDPGFRTTGILTMKVTMPGTFMEAFSPKNAFKFVEMASLAGQLPGVLDSGSISFLPMGGSNSNADLQPEGYIAPASGASPTADYHAASPGYFSAMGIPLLRGRLYSQADGMIPEGIAGTADRVLAWFRSNNFVCVISQEMARRYWPGQDPVGKRFRFGPPSLQGPWITVLGIVGNSRPRGLDQAPPPEFYFSPWQFSFNEQTIVVRTSGKPELLTKEVRDRILSVDHNVIISRAMTMEQIVRETTSSQRANLRLMGGFTVLALLLATIGIYGLMAYSVSQRQREFGVRMAMGASPAGLMRHVIGQGTRLASIGVAIGVVASLVLSRVMASRRYGTKPTDPATYVVVSLLMLSIALFAAFLPARRASQVDPMIALRSE